MDIDDIFLELGRFGKFQLRVFSLSCLTSIHLAIHMLALIFHGLDPKYHCRIDLNITSPVDTLDEEILSVLNTSLPAVTDEKTGERTFSKCTKYYNTSREDIVPCDNGWMFYRTRERYTIIEQWSLVCDNSYPLSAATIGAIFMFGVLVGSFFMVQLADQFGRKTVVLASLWIQGCLDIIVALNPSLIVFVCIYFLIGVMQAGYGYVSFVLTCEYLHTSLRMYGCVIGCIFWAFGVLLLDLFAYFIPTWWHLQLVLAACNLATIPYYWILPESIHWLVTHNRHGEAQDIIRRAAKVNGCDLIPNLKSFELQPLNTKNSNAEMPGTARHSVNLELLSPAAGLSASTPSSDEKKLHTIISIFTNRALLPRALMLCVIWFTNSLVYYGLSMFTPSMSGDIYINVMISALVEIPAYVVAMIVLMRLGRRQALMGFHTVAGLSLLAIVFIPASTASGADLTKLITTLSFVGKFGISGSFLTIFLYGAEIYPTVVRSIGIGWNGAWARLGGVLAPFGNHMATASPIITPTVFGALSLLCAMLMMFMPETANCSLPEIMADIPELNIKDLLCNGGRIGKRNTNSRKVST